MKTENMDRIVARLLEVKATDAPMLSAFATVDEQGIRSLLAEFDAKADLARSRFQGDRLAAFMDAYEDIRNYLTSDFSSETKGIAIYSRWGEAPFFLPLEFEVPLNQSLVIDTLPHLYPLIELRDRYDKFLLVLMETEKARIIGTSLGSVVHDVVSVIPELRSDAMRTLSTEHYVHIRQEGEAQLVGEKTRIIRDLVEFEGYRHILLGGNKEMCETFHNSLPADLLAMVVTREGGPLVAGQASVMEATKAFKEAEKSESKSRVLMLVDELLIGGLAVAGIEASLKALEDGYAEVLVLDQDFEIGEMREHLIRLAVRAGIEIETVKDSGCLRQLSGVGCLLRYQPDHAPAAQLFAKELLAA